jgi:hypothetical protein
MLNLYLDANTPEDLARALRAEGFEVVRAQELGLQDADDLTHLRWASEHGYALFTFDTKTMPKAIEAWGKWGGSIVASSFASRCRGRQSASSFVG